MSRHLSSLSATLILGMTALPIGSAHAAVIFGASGQGIRIGSNSSAQAKAPASVVLDSHVSSDPQSAAMLPTAPLTSSSSAAALDRDASGMSFSSSANNVTTAAFANAGAAVVTFVGNAQASAPAPGLAQAASSYFFEYWFTLTDSNPFTFDLLYSSITLGCCGNQASLQNLGSGSNVFFKNNYNADNSFSYAGNLAAGAYKLTVSKGEYFGYDAPSFNGSGSGVRSATHNDRVAFTIGTQATTPDPIPGAVPEPATWATMIAGFGLVGGAMRRRRRLPVLA